jgi:hypothetical protein
LRDGPLRIIVRLTGGLGNQLFQLAHAYAQFLEKPDSNVCLEDGWFLRDKANQAHRELAIHPEFVDIPFVNLPGFLWSSKVGIASHEGLSISTLTRLAIANGCQLESGYWQSWQMVNSVRVPMMDVMNKVRNSIQFDSAFRLPFVALHIRKGDYEKMNHVRDFHGLTNVADQIEKAQELAKNIGVSSIVAFTDSPQAVKKITHSIRNIEISEATDPWEALFGMASGQGIVMSNSSLSWWSAVYAGWASPKLVSVLMPNPWFKQPSDHDVAILVPGWETYSRTIDD